jgi:hypothetical protein
MSGGAAKITAGLVALFAILVAARWLGIGDVLHRLLQWMS